MKMTHTVKEINYHYYNGYRYYYFENIFRTVLIIQCLISNADGWVSMADIALENGIDEAFINETAKMKIDEIEAFD